MKRLKHTFSILAGWLLISIGMCLATPVYAEEPVVRAVLFFSPTCPHCHTVITEDLPPLFEQYGEQLHIVGIDISQPDGEAIYRDTIKHFNITQDRIGVPTMVVDDVVLVGSQEIPQQFPDLVASYLEQGGVDWPDIPGLPAMLNDIHATRTAEAMPATAAATATTVQTSTITATAVPPVTAETAGTQPPSLSPSPSSSSPPAPATEPTATPGLVVGTQAGPPTWQDNLARDPAGNTLALIVLVGMAVVVIHTIAAFTYQNKTYRTPSRTHCWAIPMLCVLGLGVAGYLTYVEMAQVTAVCGPVGDCNTVQQSEYARLFGVLPVGLLGMIGYVAVLVAWGVSYYAHGRASDIAALSMLALTFGGTLFSLYLTFLEPFVIGATCAWCVKSAIIMAVLLWLSIAPAKQAQVRLSGQSHVQTAS
jgi:uncharacterized membrane protein/thiol-disulfide isomerase/thioredoxin